MTEGPYKLPEGWRWVRLGEVCLSTERRDPTRDPSTPFIYVDISSVDNAEGTIVSPRALLGQDAPSRARKVIRSSDVIFATTRPYLKNVAIVGPELDGQICSTGFCVLRANRRVLEPGFLFYLCRSDLVVAQLSGNNMRGASYPAVTDRDVYEALIPLPPLSEQRRIVARIEELMARVREARRLRQQAREDAERLWQSVLAETFPRPGADLPEGWRWVKLGEVAAIRYGKANPKKPGLVPVIGSGGIYDHTEAPLVSHLTVIVGRKGSAGEVMLMEEPCWPSDTTFYLEWKCEVCPQWVYHWLRWFKPSPEGTSPTLPSLRREYLESLSIPLPPVSEQRRIVAHLEEVREHIQALKKAQEDTEARLKDLERSILDKAFRGEL